MGFFDKLFGRNAVPDVNRGDLIVRGPYAVFTRREPIGVRMVAVAVPAAEGTRPSGYDHCRRVLLRSSAAATQANGLPRTEERQRLYDEEDSFVDELSRRDVDCIKVGHFSQGGVRELVFQCVDAAGFDAAYDVWSATRRGWVELRAGSGWSFFDEVLQPRPRDRDWLTNAAVIDTATKAGTDREAIHPIDHVFLGPRASLVALSDVLRAQGSADFGWAEDELTVRETMRLDVEAITDRTQRLRKLAAEHSVQYDGWGTPIVKP